MNNKLLPKVFGWMVMGLLVTFLTGYVVSINENMLINIFSTTSMIILLIAEFGLVIFLSARIEKIKPITARLCFLLYSFVSGLFFSVYFIEFKIASLIFIFLITSIVFAIFALIGSSTKMDLTKLSTYLIMGLIGIILCGIINLFINSSTFDFVISTIGVLIFIGYTAYDVQNILYLEDSSTIDKDNLAIYGALQLYLDFINLFIHLLQIISRNKD